MGWDRRKGLRLGLSAGIVAANVIGAAVMWRSLGGPMQEQQSQPSPVQAEVEGMISADHAARTSMVSITALFDADGSGTVTVRCTIKLAPKDPLVPALRDGDVQQDASDFTNLCGADASSSAELPAPTQSLISVDYASTSVVAKSTEIARIDSAEKVTGLQWVPTLFPGDRCSMKVAVKGGIVTSISGDSVTIVSEGASSLALRARGLDADAMITLAADSASPDLLPEASSDQGEFPGPNPGLGQGVLRLLAAIWACAVAVPAVMVLRRTPGRLMAWQNLAGIAVGVAAAGGAAAVVTLSASQGVLYALILVPAGVLLFSRVMSSLELRPVLQDWSMATVILTFAGGVTALVILPDASTRAVAAEICGGFALFCAALLAIAARKTLVVLSAIAVPTALMIRLLADSSALWNTGQGVVSEWLVYVAWPGGGFAIASAAIVLARTIPGRQAHRWLTIGALLCFAVLAMLIPQEYGAPDLYNAVDGIPHDVVAIIIAAALYQLARDGRTPDAVAKVQTRRTAIALLSVVCAGYNWISFGWAGFATVTTLVAGYILLPTSTSSRALLLARVDNGLHTRHVRKMERARIFAAADRQFRQESVSRLVDGSLPIADYEKQSEELRLRATGATNPDRIQLALGTLTGSTPWQSGLAALCCASVISLPLLAETTIRAGAYSWTLGYTGTAVGWLLTVAHAMRWSVYGLLYGYFYTRLRGRTAFIKAAWFAMVMLPTEAATTWTTYPPPSAWIGVGVDAAQMFAFMVILALVWELRTARRAGINWSGVRNVHSLQAMVAPGSAILLAIVTAVATTFANTEVHQLISPQKQPAVTSTPTPGSTSRP